MKTKALLTIYEIIMTAFPQKIITHMKEVCTLSYSDFFRSLFVRLWLQSVQKVLYEPNFFGNNSPWVSKNEEFDADFKTVHTKI